MKTNQFSRKCRNTEVRRTLSDYVRFLVELDRKIEETKREIEKQGAER